MQYIIFQIPYFIGYGLFGIRRWYNIFTHMILGEYIELGSCRQWQNPWSRSVIYQVNRWNLSATNIRTIAYHTLKKVLVYRTIEKILISFVFLAKIRKVSFCFGSIKLIVQQQTFISISKYHIYCSNTQ